MYEQIARSIRRATFAARCAVAHVRMTDGPLGRVLDALDAYSDSDGDELPDPERLLEEVSREIAKIHGDMSPSGRRVRGACYSTLRAVQTALGVAPWGVGEQTAEDAAVSAAIRAVAGDVPWGGPPDVREFFAVT